MNINTPEDYAEAHARPPAEITVQRFGALAGDGRRGPRPVRAATLGEAASGVGLTLDRHVVAALNGDRIPGDGQVPLIAGDSVAFSSGNGGSTDLR